MATFLIYLTSEAGSGLATRPPARAFQSLRWTIVRSEEDNRGVPMRQLTALLVCAGSLLTAGASQSEACLFGCFTPQTCCYGGYSTNYGGAYTSFYRPYTSYFSPVTTYYA